MTEDRNVVIRLAVCGFYDLYLNGEKITKGYLAPYISNPEYLVYADEYAVTLPRNTRLQDGDIILCDEASLRLTLLRMDLNEVMEIDLCPLLGEQPDDIIHTAVALGHSLGNQHWPAVVKGCKVYVPLTVDRKVMSSVMRTHNFANITFSFRNGKEIIPYLSPHELRRLFGGEEHNEHHRHDER
jgi:urease accessory protein